VHEIEESCFTFFPGSWRAAMDFRHQCFDYMFVYHLTQSQMGHYS